jgi:hypothetical protein
MAVFWVVAPIKVRILRCTVHNDNNNNKKKKIGKVNYLGYTDNSKVFFTPYH